MVAGDRSFQILLLSSGLAQVIRYKSLAYKIGYRFSILVRLHVFWIERKTLLADASRSLLSAAQKLIS